MTRHNGEGVKSAERALSILELLAKKERPLTFVEIGSALGYPRSSLHGLMSTLVSRGWLEHDSAARAYTLGIRCWEAGNVYLRAVDLADRSRRYMERVRNALDETVQLAVLDGRHNIYIAKVDGTQQLTLASAVGRRLEAHATGVGKVLLAGLPAEELDARLAGQELERFTDRTITGLRDLKRELGQVREHGYALDHEEYTVGVRCAAVPIHDEMGRVSVAMSVSVPTVRFDAARQEAALKLLQQAAADLSSALGYQPSRLTPAR